MKEHTAHKANKHPEHRPQSLDGATFGSIDRSSYSPPSPPRPSLSNAQITLDYRVHREIFRAIVANDEAALRSAWCQHRNVSIRAEEAISWCLELERYELVNVILDLGGKPDKLRSSLLEKHLRRRFDVVKLLVEAGAPVNNEAGDSEALSRAMRFFHLHIENCYTAKEQGEKIKPFDFSSIEFLLKHGAQLDRTEPEVRRVSVSSICGPLHWRDYHYSVLFDLFEKYGIQFRSDENFGPAAQTIDAVHPIERAISGGKVNKVRELLSVEPELISLVKNPISKAILSNCSSEMIRCLIEHHCDVNEDFGKPLLYACRRFFINRIHTSSVVWTLLDCGADPSMRGAEAFLHACERFPESLGILFWETNSIPQGSAHYDAALRRLVGHSRASIRFNSGDSSFLKEPGLQYLSMVKSLVDRGADPYSAIINLLRRPSLAQCDNEEDFELKNQIDHYKLWGVLLKERLAKRPPSEVRDLDDCYRFAHGDLSRNHSLMQVGNDVRQRASLSTAAHRYCHLMAQVLEPSGECWINALIVGNYRNISESMISPSLLQHDSRYKMVSDVAAIATVLHPPFMLRQRFIELARATLSDKVKLKESQESNESVLKWLPITIRLVKHFTETALFPSLLSYLKHDAVPYLTSTVLERVNQDLFFVAAEVLFRGRTLREIKDFTKKWHALSDKHPIVISADAGWNSLLLEPIWLPGGFVVRDINSVRSLRTVGQIMNNCLADGVHASACFYGTSRILVIFQDEAPVVAMTLKKNGIEWKLTEYEGPNYTSPDEGLNSPLTHFKRMLNADEIKFNTVYEQSLPALYEYVNETSDGMFDKYSNFLDNHRTFLAVPSNYKLLWAFKAPGIDVGAFYKRWVVLNDKGGGKAEPLLRDEAIAKCIQDLRAMAEAISIFLEYSEKLYKSYPEWAVKR